MEKKGFKWASEDVANRFSIAAHGVKFPSLDNAGIVGAVPEIAGERVDDEIDGVTEGDGEGGGGVVFVAAA